VGDREDIESVPSFKAGDEGMKDKAAKIGYGLFAIGLIGMLWGLAASSLTDNLVRFIPSLGIAILGLWFIIPWTVPERKEGIQ
jgi:hypothetical protein